MTEDYSYLESPTLRKACREVDRKNGNVVPLQLPPLIQTSAGFVSGFCPPDYLIDGLLQRRFFYSITARTGSGKTAICLLLAAHVDRGLKLGNREIAKGRVLYFAGENPDDIRMRWIAMAQQLGVDPSQMNVHFVAGAMSLSKVAPRIRQEAEGSEFSLVVIDTSAAYYEGQDENDNVQAGQHARRLRELVTLPGGPTVPVCCHPPKNAGDESLLPRGGGAFIAEVDGNLICRKDDSAVELHWQGKYRGPDFAPITFQLKTVTHECLRDSRDRLIPTVIASPLSEEGRQALAAAGQAHNTDLLGAIADAPEGSLADWAKAHAQWRSEQAEGSARSRNAGTAKTDRQIGARTPGIDRSGKRALRRRHNLRAPDTKTDTNRYG
jgi:hypothetical protein